MSTGKSPFVLGLVIVAVLAVLVAIALQFGLLPSGKTLTREEYLELRETLDIAVGQLENFPLANIDETYEQFAKLHERFPEERLPKRNGAIARLLGLDIEHEKDDPQYELKVTTARQAAQAACTDLMQFEDESAESLWLGVAYLLHDNSGLRPSAERDKKAIELLKQAEAKDPENPIYPFGIFNVADVTFDDQLREAELADALERTYKLAPQNAAVVRRYLIVQAEQQDPAILQTLESSRDMLMTIRQQVLRDSGADIKDNYDAAIEGAKEGDWLKTLRSVRILSNRIKSQEVVKRDESLLTPHPLEFIEFELSENATAGVEVAPELATVEVAWVAPEPVSNKPAVDVQVGDFTLDGQMELIVLQSDVLQVLSFTGGQWSVINEVEVAAGARGLRIADLDMDNKAVGAEPEPPKDENAVDDGSASAEVESCYVADIDFVVFGAKGVQMIRNVLSESGERSLELVEQEEAGWSELSDVRTVELVDIDHDADLDLVVSSDAGISIWSNRGATSMEFYRLDEWSSLPPADQPIDSIAAVDWDRDVDIDLLVGGADQTLRGVLTNMRHARFAWTVLDDPWKGLEKAAMIRPLEADGNASWDAVVVGEDGVRVLLTQTPQPGKVRLLRTVQVDEQAATGVAVLDFDNDGAVDLAAWTSSTLRLYRGQANGQFNPVDANLPVDGEIQSVRVADIDLDGDLDLAIATDAGVRILANAGGNQNNWVAIRARGRQDNRGRANDSGIGALIELKTGALYQAQVVDSQVAHFGLGDIDQANVARIVWTNGVPQDILKPQRNTLLCEWMVLKGSCPYLYTWNGERFVFQTDCLWAAPVGLQVAEGVLAPTRPWEYLKIPGENLKPRDGFYEIQLTEELWEIAYFDYVKLIAIDHPEEIDVYSNEKVGPPSIAEYRVHTAADPRPIRRAVDQRGRDVTQTLRDADDRFVKAFDRQIYQGLTPEHYVELDLGELSSPEKIKLFLRGWLRPTDTSLNVAFSQNPSLDGPRFPSVWTPDANGQFVEVQPYMGFPGGKTKTIVVDLSDAFATDDYRVRIVSTAEIYWDQAFFTIDEPEAELEIGEMAVHDADLHYRGFSERIRRPHFAPYDYDYDTVTTHPIWPPIEGRFTRFGDVTPLLATEDDQSVVIGSGDEVTVRFRALDPPQAGWKRDFFLHCVGWDKDADLNTIHGQSVEPLPYRGMKSYPYEASDGPQGPSWEAYLRKYQTRRQNPARFWRRMAAQ